MKYVNAVEKAFLSFCMIFATILLFCNVGLRYFFHTSIIWAEETLRYVICWITFIGISMCVKDDAHISIDVLSNLIPKAAEKYLKLGVHVIGLVFYVLFSVLAFHFISQIKATGQVSATIGNIPMYLIYLCFPIGFVLSVIQSLSKIVTIIKEVR
jgi:C4-dicarboxylate transporter, DctQ subunit